MVGKIFRSHYLNERAFTPSGFLLTRPIPFYRHRNM